MKLHKLLPVIAMLAIMATGCKEDVIMPGDNTNNQGSLLPPDTTAQLITLAQARAIIDSIAADSTTATGKKTSTTYAPGRYKLQGTIIKNSTNPISVPGQTRRNININFDLGDETDTLSCFYIKNLNNLPFTSSNQVPRVGSKLAIIAQLEWYVNDKNGNTSYEAANGFIIRMDEFIAPEPVPDCPAPGEGQISVSEAFQIAMRLDNKATTEESYDVIGIVSEITENGMLNGYKNATFNITDNKEYLVGYRINGFSQPENIAVGDTVVIRGGIQNYGGLAEISSGKLVSTTNSTMNEDTTKVDADPEGIEIPEGCLNVYQARHLCAELESGSSTKEKHYVKGWVYKLDAKNEDGINNYGNATFYICATKDGSTKTFDFEAFQVYAKDGKKFYSVDQVKEGDFVVIYGKLTNYNGTYETVGKGAAYVYASTNPEFDPKEDPTKITPDPEGVTIPEGCLTVYEARAICSQLASGKKTSDKKYVKGWIHKLDSKNADGIKNYGNATFYIAATNDGKTVPFDFEAFQVYGPGGKKFTDENQVAVGDFVILYGQLTNYNGTYETVGKGAAYVYYTTNPNAQPEPAQ